MALFYVDYNVSVSATSVDVEHIFSHSHLILSHIRSQLSAQSIHALLCVGSWSLLGLVKDSDVLAVSAMKDLEGNDEIDLKDGWNSILL